MHACWAGVLFACLHACLSECLPACMPMPACMHAPAPATAHGSRLHLSRHPTRTQAAKLQQMSLKPKPDGEAAVKLEDDDTEEVSRRSCSPARSYEAREEARMQACAGCEPCAKATCCSLPTVLGTHPLHLPAAGPSRVPREPHQGCGGQEGQGHQPLPPQVPGGALVGHLHGLCQAGTGTRLVRRTPIWLASLIAALLGGNAQAGFWTDLSHTGGAWQGHHANPWLPCSHSSGDHGPARLHRKVRGP